MAWSFGDGFDLYGTGADLATGYWDSTTGNAGNFFLLAGRFAGSLSLNITTNGIVVIKSSAVNDAAHHLAFSFYQSSALTGSTNGFGLTLYDGTTAQCGIVFRSDGAMLFLAGYNGATLATYTGAVPLINTWYHFEVEIIINNTTGSFKVRRNGNSTEDFTATGLNTRASANNYANKLQMSHVTATVVHRVDDLFWKSDASSVAWMGDIRCQTRMPASDSAVTWSRTPTTNTQTTGALFSTNAITADQDRYTPFIPVYDGTIGTATIALTTGYTGSMKCSIFASSGTAPTTVLGSATAIVNPVTGVNTFTFGTPVAVAKGTQYWIGFNSNTTSGTMNNISGTSGKYSSTTYASFPVASPSVSTTAGIVHTLTITVNVNYTVVNEAQQDALTTYVSSSNVGDADFYGIASIPSTPASVIAVTTRSYLQKSDAATRSAAVQVKSGATTVASPTVVLTTSGWQWAWRTDLVDPNTSAAWTPAAVNNMTVGPKVIA